MLHGFSVCVSHTCTQRAGDSDGGQFAVPPSVTLLGGHLGVDPHHWSSGSRSIW